MIVLHSSAVDALQRQEKERAYREYRMRNALEILASDEWAKGPLVNLSFRFVQRVAREGLGRETE